MLVLVSLAGTSSCCGDVQVFAWFQALTCVAVALAVILSSRTPRRAEKGNDQVGSRRAAIKSRGNGGSSVIAIFGNSEELWTVPENGKKTKKWV